MPHVRMEQLGFRPDPQHDAANYGVVGVLCALGATAEQGEQDGEDHSDAGDRPGGKVLDDTIMMNTGMEIQAEASASSGGVASLPVAQFPLRARWSRPRQPARQHSPSRDAFAGRPTPARRQ